jgi:hypothetical protein
MNRTIAQVAGGLAACALFIGMVAAAEASNCSPANIAGTYGYTSNGSIVTPPFGPFVAVGVVTFDKSGTLSGAQVTSIAGNFFDETFEGPFTVNPDCTGSAVVSVFHGTALARVTNLHLVWDDDRQEVRGLFLTPGTAISIVARKMDGGD